MALADVAMSPGRKLLVSVSGAVCLQVGGAHGEFDAMSSSCIKRVLIADDNVDAGDTLGSFLELLGLEVVVVRDGLAAVSEAARSMPDVVILDLSMPGINGWAACEQIRKLPGGAKARVLALSAWGSDEARARSSQAGFDGHWTKPTDPAVLLSLISE